MYQHVLRYAIVLKAVFILFLSSTSVHAENLSITNQYGNFLYSEKIPNTLFFFDKINRADSFELRKALRNHEIDIIVLSSPGGSVFEGLQMAGIIHDNNINTHIPQNTACVSACSFMFFAGKQRSSSGILGVHQFYSKNGSKEEEVSQTEKIAQYTVSEIIGFLNEFNTPPFVFERMFQQSEMYFFSDSELSNITTRSPRELQDFDNLEKFAQSYLASKSEPSSQVTDQKKPVKTIKEKEQIDPKLVQAELNRIGCNLGAVDGLIGPASRRALKTYTKIAGITYEDTLFTSPEFLEEIRKVPLSFCPELKAPRTQRAKMKRHAIYGKMDGQYKINGVCDKKYTFSGKINIKFKKNSLFGGKVHSATARLKGDHFNGTYTGEYSETLDSGVINLLNQEKTWYFKLILIPLEQIDTSDSGWAMCGTSGYDILGTTPQCSVCITG